MFFRSIKEINRLKVRACQTFTIEESWRSQNYFSLKENFKKSTSFEEQKGARYIRENVSFGIITFNCLSSTKACLRFLLTCFAWEIKSFYQSSLRNEVDFTDMKNVSQISWLKINILEKLRHGFVDKRAMIIMTIISLGNWKTLVPFCLTWKSIFNTNKELLQIRTEKTNYVSQNNSKLAT